MFEESIQYMEISDLLKTENICIVQAQPPDVREQLKALYFARLMELKADKTLKDQVKRVFKTLDDAERLAAQKYTKEYAEKCLKNMPIDFDQKRYLEDKKSYLLEILK